MEKYAAYACEDFVGDDEFINWVLSGDKDSDAFWHSFVRRYPFQSENIEQARQIVLKLHEAASEQEKKAEQAEIWNSLQQSIARKPEGFSTTRKWWAAIGSVAAAVALLLLSGRVWNEQPPFSGAAVTEAGKVVITNELEAVATYYLPDSSAVTLQPGSRLSYAAGFSGDLRDVYLSGEAFFEVTPDPRKPFQVHASDLMVKVLGTSFNVKDDGENITVAVKTGKVSVFRQQSSVRGGQEPDVLLGSNEQVAYTKGTAKLEKSIVADPMPILEDTVVQSFVFNNQPLPEIFKALETAYGIKISYNAEVMGTCRLTTSLGKETLFEKLDVICTALDASYSVEEDQIVVNGKRCQ